MKEVYIVFFYNLNTNKETIVSTFKTKEEAESYIIIMKECVCGACKLYYEKAIVSENIYTE